MFCVALWCLDEYWYYSLFTLFMLIVFECTVVWQVSVRAYVLLAEGTEWCRVASAHPHRIQDYGGRAVPHPVQARRQVGDYPDRRATPGRRSVNRYVPPNHVQLYLLTWSATAVHQQTETTVPADILLVHGNCIVNEAMLSGESTPLLKESIELLEGTDKLDVDVAHKNQMLFSGTKVLQARSGGRC